MEAGGAGRALSGDQEITFSKFLTVFPLGACGMSQLEWFAGYMEHTAPASAQRDGGLAMSICEDMVGFGAVEKTWWKPREG